MYGGSMAIPTYRWCPGLKVTFVKYYALKKAEAVPKNIVGGEFSHGFTP